MDDICTYGSFENNYVGLQLFMVAIRTDLSAKSTPNAKSTPRGHVLMLVRVGEV